jgi:UDP-3-O-[3-hydroxymyristoyl] glucosamine N-acyltransferase
MGEQVEIDFNHVVIRPPVVIGHRCTILPGAEIGPHAVLGDGWICHSGARIRDAVLWGRHGHYANGSASATAVRAVSENVVVDTSIVVGGVISQDVYGQTVDVLPDGTLDVRDLDWVPSGPRA